MPFDPNSSFMYALVSIVILFVIAQSVFFLVKAWRRAKVLRISATVLKKAAVSSALFTIAPALTILLGVITLSKLLGLPLPWLRLSVLGALTYELPAAKSAADAMGLDIGKTVTDASAFATIAWVMTLGILPPLILVPLFGKKIQKGIVNLKSKDSKWGELFVASLFLGMISAFLGYVFADISKGLHGWIPVCVMLVSAAAMAVCGLLIKRYKMRWLEEYALPISMLCALAAAIPIAGWLG